MLVEGTSDARAELLAARRVDHEPTDERGPQVAEAVAEHEAEEAHADQEDAEHEPAARRRDLRGAAVLAPRPQRRGQHAATVEGRAGQEVEDGEDDVDDPEIDRDRREQAAVGERRVEAECRGDEDCAEREAHGRARDRDEELAARVGRFVAQAGDAAEEPQRDALDPLTPPQRDQCVRQLVGEDRGEEERGREHGRGPVGAARLRDEVGEDAGREGAGDHDADHEQAPVHADLDPAEPAEPDRRTQGRVLSSAGTTLRGPERFRVPRSCGEPHAAAGGPH